MPAVFSTIGPTECRAALAMGRARRAGQTRRLAATLAALSARGLRVGFCAPPLSADLCADRRSTVAGMTHPDPAGFFEIEYKTESGEWKTGAFVKESSGPEACRLFRKLGEAGSTSPEIRWRWALFYDE